MEILQYFIYFIIICAFVNIGGFIVSGLIRVYKSINNGRGGAKMISYPCYNEVFGIMLGLYVILQMLHVADLCAHE